MVKEIIIALSIACAVSAGVANAQRGYLSESRFIGYEPANLKDPILPIFFEHEKFYKRAELRSLDEFLAADLMSQFNVQKAKLDVLPFTYEMKDTLGNGIVRTVPAIHLEVIGSETTYLLEAVERQNRDAAQTSNFIFQSAAKKTVDKTSETAPLTKDVLMNEALTLTFIHIPSGERVEVYSGRFVRMD